MPPPHAVAEFAALEAALDAQRREVDAALRRLHQPARAPEVAAAIEDSLFAPAKRIRPVLALMVAEVLRGDPRPVLPAACAIEMVHTASLILDDLPCMDDAAQRRGRPACHVAHGEATAILAAFALQNRAFELLAAGWPGGPDAAIRAAVAADLAKAIGLDGMIAGQAKDLALTDQAIDFPTLEFIHSRKTGALFIASAALGARAAGAGERERQAVAAYAKNLGLAFQIVDDLIDVAGAADEAGKDVGKDLKKTTFVSFSGHAGARQLAEELAAVSQEALAGFGPRAQPLRDLARYVVARRR
jgi:geranylgeranyl diphosphate synthase type II